MTYAMYGSWGIRDGVFNDSFQLTMVSVVGKLHQIVWMLKEKHFILLHERGIFEDPVANVFKALVLRFLETVVF